LAGVAAFSFAIVAGGMARIILGIHYPFDIIAGALVGIGTVATSLWLMKAAHLNSILSIKSEYPYVFYSSMFLVTVEIGVIFDDIRFFLRGIRISLHDLGYESLGLFAALAIGVAGLLALSAAIVCIIWIMGRSRRSDRNSVPSSLKVPAGDDRRTPEDLTGPS
jgi:hypothetical protein